MTSVLNSNGDDTLSRSRPMWQCDISFLDCTTRTYSFHKHSKGSALLECVWNLFSPASSKLIGLKIDPNCRHNRIWLSADKSLKKQAIGPIIKLSLEIRFFVPYPSLLEDRLSSSLYYLQLRALLANGVLKPSPVDAVIICSYILQSSKGNFVSIEESLQFLEVNIVPGLSAANKNESAQKHKLFRGMTKREAENYFLEIVSQLDRYGCEFFVVHSLEDSLSGEYELGISSEGIIVFQNYVKKRIMPWELIVRISVNGPKFYIHLKEVNSAVHEQTLGFSCDQYNTCKQLYDSCVAIHTFFHLTKHKEEESAYSTILTSSINAFRKFSRKVRSRAGSVSKAVRPSTPSRSAERNQTIQRVASQPGDNKLHVNHSQNNSQSARAASLENFADIDSVDANSELDSLESVTITITSDDHGKFGFTFNGGSENGITVSRVAPNSPADTCCPKLTEGDRIVAINGISTTQLSNHEITNLIKEAASSTLVLKIAHNSYSTDFYLDEPDILLVGAEESSNSAANISSLHDSMIYLEQSLLSNLATQFEQLPRFNPTKSFTAAHDVENTGKNRYRDILPYDETRVLLKGDDLDTDYINANYVSMHLSDGVCNNYIASQGPLPHTVSDFWQMIWGESCELIIMLTGIQEKGRVKCHQYWPPVGERVLENQFQIQTLDEREDNSLLVRRILLSNEDSGEERQITHVQYLSWPDHGYPDDASVIIHLLRIVRNYRHLNSQTPILVHCSAGIGRTGVLILMENAICRMKLNEPILPLYIVEEMRDQRPSMVQTTDQFIFSCNAVLNFYNEKFNLDDF